MNLTWSDLGAMAGIGGSAGAVLFYAALGRFGMRFATRADHAEHGARLDALEARLAHAPTREDFERLSQSVSNVSIQTATLTERVDGVKGSLNRIEGTLKLFVDARLQWEKDR